MLIGELAKQSYLSRDTIRFYEKLGLIKPDQHVGIANNYKHYSSSVLERLRQIRLLKKCGFTLQEIQTLLRSSAQGKACAGLPERLADKMAVIEDKITELILFKSALLQIYQSCNSACAVNNGLPSCVDGDGDGDGDGGSPSSNF